MAEILVVEDTTELAQVLERELAAEGYSVRLAATGQAAIASFGQHPPDLVILDWMLPQGSGIDVLQHIRRTSAVPVLMLTARSEESDRVIGLELGADDYLTKPFGLRELVARVRALLRRHERLQQQLLADRSHADQPLHYAALVLDPTAHLATLNGAALDLSRTEFDLLQLLLRNPGRAFSRNYLLDAIWGEAFVTGDRSVDNAILRLRKKLGPLGDQIETVWGVGYRLKPE